MQYQINSDRQVNNRFHYRWSKSLISKASVALSPESSQQGHVVELDHDYQGSDFHLGIKLMNPSILEGAFTGISTLEYLQSVTPRLSLGMSTVYQRRSTAEPPDAMTSYGARYKGQDWIGSANFIPRGVLKLAYWRRIAPKIETGADLQLMMAPPSPEQVMFGLASGPKFEGAATLGAKYEFRSAMFRAQIDSQGRLGCYLDKRIAPPVGVQFFGQIDHVKVSLLPLLIGVSKADRY
jgi:mitochondrial import receptor subunit TOM40